MVKSRSFSFSKVMLVLGLLFLYLPMFVLIVYSFNASRLVSVWAGFSTHWYGELFRDEQILSAVWMSLRIAFYSASMAVCLGTLCAFVITRFKTMRGRTLLSSMITAPLVMPEVITGLSLLLLFVAMESMFGWPAGRGTTTIVIAHTTFCLAYVAVVVQSRLSSMDETLEEAAMDLGAKPVSLFFLITLPLIAPAILSGWLLSFTLSLDDLVIASFVSGPGNSTLPMVIFSKVRLGVTPEINALATLMILVVSIAVIAAIFIMRRQNRFQNP